MSLSKDRPHAHPGTDRCAGAWLIGWKEYVGFPDWGLHNVKVKIDTGARTSALDVQGYHLRHTDNGLAAELRVGLYPKRPDDVRVVLAPVVKMVVVSNTGGGREERPVIEVRVQLGPVTKVIPVTITSRAGMLFRMILGRKALEGDFVVDVRRKYVLSHAGPRPQ